MASSAAGLAGVGGTSQGGGVADAFDVASSSLSSAPLRYSETFLDEMNSWESRSTALSMTSFKSFICWYCWMYVEYRKIVGVAAVVVRLVECSPVCCVQRETNHRVFQH